jgi:hypothetical protein
MWLRIFSNELIMITHTLLPEIHQADEVAKDKLREAKCQNTITKSKELSHTLFSVFDFISK